MGDQNGEGKGGSMKGNYDGRKNVFIEALMSKKKPKFSFEIDVTDHQCHRFARWANYGTIVTEGNTLDELLDNASVDVMDQDGGELSVGPADAYWMVDAITAKYHEPKRAKKGKP